MILQEQKKQQAEHIRTQQMMERQLGVRGTQGDHVMANVCWSI